MKNVITTILFLFFFFTEVMPQTSGSFDVDKYKLFLSQNKNINSTHLNSMYPAGDFKSGINSNANNALYYDSVVKKYTLTSYEKSLIEKQGFMVSERLNYKSAGEGLIDIYNKDLPLFISTDVLLHAFHFSYDMILQDIEGGVIIPNLKSLLITLHSKTKDLNEKYTTEKNMGDCLKDFDVYLTVALKLLGVNESPYYPDNMIVINQLMGLINAGQSTSYAIFGNSIRTIDFSQFKPRGHYTDSDELKNYFKAVMWLGRIEFYMIAPESSDYTDPVDVRRQSADAMLVLEAADIANIYDAYDKIEQALGFFVGPQDNVSLPDMKELRSSAGLSKASELLDSVTYMRFSDVLKTKPYANQKILSQILTNDPQNPDNIVPASSFMLFGQRFVIDSYVTGNVVYDKVRNINDQRLLPSTLDILFALGNNAASVLLKPELDKYNYSVNLSGLRYLLDSYGSDIWNSTIYNMWLNSIRALNPPADKTLLPAFMQTAAYWQEKINTQLASWAELRHDNLLYAKQSYTGGFTCSYPYVYVEPIPEFYNNIKTLCEISRDKFNSYNFDSAIIKPRIVNYFDQFAKTADTLAIIAAKELANTPFSDVEKSFLQRTITEIPDCVPIYIGWYTKLFYLGNGFTKQNYIVADVHTVPTDQWGAPLGWIKHAGTGPVNMGVWVADLPGTGKIAFSGPVMSYYEYTTTNFLRLTDDEWLNTYQQTASRPDFVNLYLADNSGLSKGSGMVLTGIENTKAEKANMPTTYLTAVNYPNPFNPSTVICYTIPKEYANKKTELSVYNITGELVKKLVDNELPAGTYYTRWDGKNSMGASAASGIYLYRLTNSGKQVTGKMNMVK